MQREILAASGATATYWEVTSEPLDCKVIWREKPMEHETESYETRDYGILHSCRMQIENDEHYETILKSANWIYPFVHRWPVRDISDLIPCILNVEHVRCKLFGDLFMEDNRERNLIVIQRNGGREYCDKMMNPLEIKKRKQLANATFYRAITSMEDRGLMTQKRYLGFDRGDENKWHRSYTSAVCYSQPFCFIVSDKAKPFLVASNEPVTA